MYIALSWWPVSRNRLSGENILFDFFAMMKSMIMIRSLLVVWVWSTFCLVRRPVGAVEPDMCIFLSIIEVSDIQQKQNYDCHILLVYLKFAGFSLTYGRRMRRSRDLYRVYVYMYEAYVCWLMEWLWWACVVFIHNYQWHTPLLISPPVHNLSTHCTDKR